MIKYKVRRSIALLAMAFFMLPLTVDAQKISNNQRTTILSDLDENIRLLSKFQYDTPELITNYAAQLSDAAQQYGITPETVVRDFYLIQQDWKTGET